MEPVVLSRYLSSIVHDCRENLGHTCKSLARVLSLSLSLDNQKGDKLIKKENGGDEGLIVIPLGLLSPLISKSVPPHFAKDNAQPFVCIFCKCVISNQPCIRLIHDDQFKIELIYIEQSLSQEKSMGTDLILIYYIMYCVSLPGQL